MAPDTNTKIDYLLFFSRLCRVTLEQMLIRRLEIRGPYSRQLTATLLVAAEVAVGKVTHVVSMQ